MKTNKRIRIIALLATCLMLLAMLFACVPVGDDDPTLPPGQADYDDTPPPADIHSLTLPFARGDVLNPYRAATQLNLELATLLYEGLFLTDETHNPQPVLARSIEQTSPTQFTVRLRNRSFHNGRRVTAQDVVYSWQQARQSENFSARVESISNMQARDGEVDITLNRANVFIAANLDFPIVPQDSAGYGPLSQAVNGYHFTLARTPVGTGRYQLARQDDAFVLVHNEDHPDFDPTLTTIALHSVNNSAALLHGLEMGNYHFAFYDLSSGELPGVGAATFRVATTNFVFLGFNGSRSLLQDASLRAALAACLDISAVLTSAFSGYANATDTPFPASFHGLEDHDLARPFNATNARRALEELGFTELRGGTRARGNGTLSFDLVVRRENPAKMAAAALIRTQLAAFQVEVNIRALDHDDYNSAIAGGNFDLYLGELRLTPDLNLSPLLLSGGVATRGVDVWGRAASAYGQLLQGLIAPEDFVEVFWEDVPFLPLGYRAGMAVATRALRTPADFRRNDLFANIADWHF